MDYERIYRELIADRRANPPSENEYVEVHHILPRCMGGGNEPENLIRLRPEDHFFAHLLLAKVHGGSLWYAVRIMAAAAIGAKPEVRSYRFGRTMPGFKGRYGLAKRWANVHLTGLGHPNADTTIYVWEHVSGVKESLTQIELCAKYGLGQSHVSCVVRGVQKSANGWFLSDRHTAETIGLPVGMDHHMADKTVYSFRHVDGREFSGTRLQLAANDNVPQASINNIVAGKGLSAYGWYLPDLAQDGIVGSKAQSGDRSGTADKNVYLFRRAVDGEERICTRNELIEEFGLTRSSFNAMMAGESLSSQGWYLPDRNPGGIIGTPTGERNNKFNPTIYHFIHDDGREERLTLFAMHKLHGGNRACWNKPIAGGTYKGWRLYGNNPDRSFKGKPMMFANDDGSIFCGTQKELADNLGVSQATTCRIAKQITTYKGWRVLPDNDNKADVAAIA